ncbi:hypothetical protein PPBDW_II0925 [Photobacterium kishitanii]|nr:hypothetical protein PPBDW_II0925 [Photobacterium kishitanii]
MPITVNHNLLSPLSTDEQQQMLLLLLLLLLLQKMIKGI